MRKPLHTFKVYFELFGKKLCKTVVSETEEQAKKAIAESIKFHKIEDLGTNKDAEDFIKMFNDLFK